MNNQLKLLSLLCRSTVTTRASLAQKMEISANAVGKILKKLNDEQFVIRERYGKVELLMWDPGVADLRSPCFFEAEERVTLLAAIQCLPMSDQLRFTLSAKLTIKNDPVSAPIIACDPEAMMKIRVVNCSIRLHRQVVLKDYQSGSGKVSDHTVEPVDWSANYRQLHVFDVEKDKMMTFVPARAAAVVPLEAEWHHERQHKPIEEDVFWMSGDEVEEVTIAMSQLALNLLHEEHPLSRQYEVAGTRKGQGTGTRPTYHSGVFSNSPSSRYARHSSLAKRSISTH